MTPQQKRILEDFEAAIGDRLCAEQPLSKEYAGLILSKLRALLTENQRLMKALVETRRATKLRNGDYKNGRGPKTIARDILKEHAATMLKLVEGGQ